MIKRDTQAYSEYVNSLSRAEYLGHWIKNLVPLKMKMNTRFLDWLGDFAGRYSEHDKRVMHEAWNDY